MREHCLGLKRRPPFARPIATNELRAENARLRRLCADAKDIASRHELALREGDHRIKNSLQIVASLLSIQERRGAIPAVRDALRAAGARIEAVSRMHDALQLNGSKDSVDLGALIQAMCVSLHAMAGDPVRVKVIVKANAIQAPILLAQPIVLAVNELVVNALRHAFPEDASGTVFVTLELTDGELRVVVADDGAGLPTDHSKSGGFGMKLVHMMAAKIGATLSIESIAGARFTLSAPYAA